MPTRCHELPNNGPDGREIHDIFRFHKNALIVGLDDTAGRIITRPIISTRHGSTRSGGNVKPHVFTFGHEPAFRTYSPRLSGRAPRPARRDVAEPESRGGRTYFCCHDHYYDHAWVDDGDGNPDNDIHQLIVATAGAPFYTWKPPYDGNNGQFVPQQVYHVENHYGYVLVEVNDWT